MKYLSLLISLLVVQSTFAQRQVDTLETTDGPLTIHPVLHGTVAFTWRNEIIYVDPYGGIEGFKGLKDPTIILITDIHGDHLNLPTLEAINTQWARIFAPQAVIDKLPEELRSQAVPLGNGQTMVYKDLELLAVPMYNLPESEDSRHPKGRGNGYVMTVGEKRIYISGDTEDIPEMRNLENIDLAFVCMNLPYTMDVNQAADAVNEFKPGIVYPYHYRGKEGLSDVAAFKELVDQSNSDVEVRLRVWYR